MSVRRQREKKTRNIGDVKIKMLDRYKRNSAERTS